MAELTTFSKLVTETQLFSHAELYQAEVDYGNKYVEIQVLKIILNKYNYNMFQ